MTVLLEQGHTSIGDPFFDSFGTRDTDDGSKIYIFLSRITELVGLRWELDELFESTGPRHLDHLHEFARELFEDGFMYIDALETV
jgi:hypothetical protein